jgi:peptide/nickel transport system permease protein
VARPTLITYAAIRFSALIGGAAIVETIFAWNGLGQWAVTAILKHDIFAIQGFILVSGLVTLTSYVAADMLVALADPRVSYS